MGGGALYPLVPLPLKVDSAPVGLEPWTMWFKVRRPLDLDTSPSPLSRSPSIPPLPLSIMNGLVRSWLHYQWTTSTNYIVNDLIKFNIRWKHWKRQICSIQHIPKTSMTFCLTRPSLPPRNRPLSQSFDHNTCSVLRHCSLTTARGRRLWKLSASTLSARAEDFSVFHRCHVSDKTVGIFTSSEWRFACFCNVKQLFTRNKGQRHNIYRLFGFKR